MHFIQFESYIFILKKGQIMQQKKARYVFYCLSIFSTFILLYLSSCYTDIEQLIQNRNNNERYRLKVIPNERNLNGSHQHLAVLAWSQDMPEQSCRIENGLTCQLIKDKNLYNMSEAVIFNLGKKKYWRDFPHYKLEHHKWVIVEYEMPPTCGLHWPPPAIMAEIRGAFNITMFRVPDAILPYPALIYDDPIYVINSKILDNNYQINANYSSTKSRNVAWFVSHCPTQSQRENYVKELQKYIDVDIYGTCGNLTCGERYTGSHDNICDRTLLNTTYRFYLSFENSFCRGYVTEKLHRIMREPINIIPVVMGLANYSVLLPEKTYIDTKDFDSPKSLAAYLKTVAENSSLFNEYIMRKNSLQGTYIHGPDLLCHLCQFLHENYDKHIVEPDILSFWSVKRRCLDPWKVIPGDFWIRD